MKSSLTSLRLIQNQTYAIHIVWIKPADDMITDQ